MRRWSIRLGLLAASTFVSLLVAELLIARFGPPWLRWDSRTLEEQLEASAASDPDPTAEVSLKGLIRASANPRLIYELKPGMHVRFQREPVTINSDGFRGTDVSREKADGVERILLLGDSTLFGWGIPDGKTFPELLASRLAAGRDGAQVEVLNFGVPGYNTMQEAEQLESVGIEYRPDVVVVVFVPNDDELARFVVQGKMKKSLLHFDRLRELADEAASTVEGDMTGFRADEDHVPPEYRSLVGSESIREGLRRMAYLSRRHGFRLYLFALGGAQPVTSSVVQWCSELGITFLDFDGYLADHGRGFTSADWVSPHDAHPNAAFQPVIADFLAASIAKR